ncbi:hypothetical protein GUITHDRAFT_101220 [Guillardia theta CCMP2712]|uniref:Uncharacterized protein n=1 Tax=Guillardia theta (strain CCMP2712) TaxID=905079 RepID=L1JZ83_GUITC|nr:hypothetical protein GUITHDRAFT_101220 [Guillardia theta CCMP2712]EKX53520.1 hypothetical protein GUITHDRAFT_101220 [Guillardia theta CCMP2712]|eukprot:XP_005840500.1 hypothetical protein GUITHDRAFT_101220 [Guillardia theta CCMP2712]
MRTCRQANSLSYHVPKMSLTPSKQTAAAEDAPTVKKRPNPSDSNSRPAKKQKVYTSVPRTRKGVIAMIQSWGYENVEEASKCAIGGLARGALKIDFNAKLDSIAWKGVCEYCQHPLQTTLRALLDQPDSGIDYEEGSPGAAIVCPNASCGERYYLTCMCANDAYPTLGKYHKHCRECPGFGMCMPDCRFSHCNVCHAKKESEMMWQSIARFRDANNAGGLGQ